MRDAARYSRKVNTPSLNGSVASPRKKKVLFSIPEILFLVTDHFRMIPNECGASVDFFLDTDGCYNTRMAVNYLEHVQAKISLNFNPRGNLRIILQSPDGTRLVVFLLFSKLCFYFWSIAWEDDARVLFGNVGFFLNSSTLLFPRPQDMYKSSFDDWPFLSVHFWGERPAGQWRLTVVNECSKTVLQPGR